MRDLGGVTVGRARLLIAAIDAVLVAVAFATSSAIAGSAWPTTASGAALGLLVGARLAALAGARPASGAGGLGATLRAISLGSLLFVTAAFFLLPEVPSRLIVIIEWSTSLLLVAARRRLLPGPAPVRREALDRAAADRLRAVRPAALLGRRTIELDDALPRRRYRARCVLVTGAAGSIGSEICRQLLPLEPRRIVMVDQAESGLYLLQVELARAAGSVDLVPVVGDVTDEAKMQAVARAQRPDVVFHAAAYKQVPLMEADPLEAIRNNVVGTQVILEATAAAGASRFVLVSTDKAVRPVGIMGMTKRVAETLARALAPPSCVAAAVRFGNVLGSVGSFMPLFKQQLADGGTITITDPDAERFLMLVSEAAQLVLHAGAMSRNGGTYVLEIGDPVRVGAVLERLLEQAGLSPADVHVERIGLRPGERLREALVEPGEELVPTDEAYIGEIRPTPLDGAAIGVEYAHLRARLRARDASGAVAALRRLARVASTRGEAPRPGRSSRRAAPE